MGATVLCYAVVGVLARKSDLETITEESCEHPERAGLKFCPECGVKVETTEETDDGRWEEFSYGLKLPRGYVSGEMHDYCSSCSHLLVGWGVRQSWHDSAEGIPGYSGTLVIPSEDEIKAVLREHFKPWPELYDEKTFGFHVYQYYS